MSAAAADELACDPLVREAISQCRAVTRSRAGNFYWGLRLTPEPRRSAMYAIYAWMRQADDIVDSDALQGAAQVAAVEEFRRATEVALAGEVAQDAPLWRALAAVARKYPLDPTDFRSMLDGQVADLRPRSIATWDELRIYCRQVAGTVGSVCVRIWGYSDPTALDLAVERGIAFQLTNIVRDVAEDASMGRVYLPQEEFDRCGLTPDELRAWSRPQPCQALMTRAIGAAQGHFDATRRLDAMVDAPCRPTLRAMSGIYERLLSKIARDPAQVVQGRVSLNKLQKVMIALRASMGREP